MGSLHRTVLGVDVEGFCAPGRTVPDQISVREALYRAMREAFGRSGIPWDACRHEDRGDGALVLVPPDVPKERLSGELPRELAMALDEHNSASGPNARIKLRMALHAGEVHSDPHGVVGTCVNLCFRLLDSAPCKEALARSDGPLAVVVSEWFFEEVVRHHPGSDPGDYKRFRVRVKEARATGFVRLVDGSGHGREVRADPGRPEIWRVPRRNRFFTGRREILERVGQALLAPGDPSAACVLHGMGGVGKSQLARETAHLLAPRFDGVWWVDAGDPFSLVRDLNELADRLGVARGGAGRRAGVLYHELARRGERWLIVYDNAEDQADLEPWWPAVDIGSVLVTSRTSSWRLADTVHVPPFTRDESLAFLAKATGGAPEEAAPVAAVLGDLPLALAQAAAYVTRNRTGWRRYSELLDRSPAQMMHLNQPDDYYGTAATTWSMSMARVTADRPDSARLLRLLTFFDPDHIPRDVMTPGLRTAPAWLRALADEPVRYDEAVGTLSEYALFIAVPLASGAERPPSAGAAAIAASLRLAQGLAARSVSCFARTWLRT
ncbi:NB-ARC domain-containing protein [Actinomadura rubrisoli]|uniref:NB-ARC domain-containing protein n=1 Tax=Actinomadura rubrisoli TaxID=2530368 RepID=A0A4R5BEE9_9ACTN|nr:NB-ARC domain-containing protein [Actinomadura rubrisoli]TDD84661.1 hypothetical protein E1298_19705 [Actinomadura rubrisoli]